MIRQYIHTVRKQLADFHLLKGIVGFILVLALLTLLLATTESLFYLDPNQRTRLLTWFGAVFAVFLCYLILRWIIHRKAWLGNSTDEAIAAHIGNKVPHIADRLLNAYQLESDLKPEAPGQDLIRYAVDKVNQQLQKTPAALLKDKIPHRILVRFFTIVAGVLVIFAIFQRPLFPALLRLAHPGTTFPVPVPFTLLSVTGNQDVLGGDSLQVNFRAEGTPPDSLVLNWITGSMEHQMTLPLADDTTSYLFTNIKADIVYYAEVSSDSWFSPWGRVATDTDTIFVTDRPVVESLEFTIIPPNYTGEQPWTHPGNVTDISLLAGSTVQVTATATKSLSMAWALIGDNRETLKITGRGIRGTFTVEEDKAVAIYCLDENNVGNLNPAQYRFTVLPDFPPDLLVAEPEREIDLDESLAINFNLQISDDFGFSGASIDYRINHPEYLTPDTTTYSRDIPELIPAARSQQVFHTWDVSELGLSPDDELQFQIKLLDNNILTGPGKTISAIFTARFPSLEDLYRSLGDSEDSALEESEDLKMSLEDVKELVEELNLEMLKSDDVNWEQQQKTEDILNKMENVTQQIDEMQDALSQISEQLEKNNLVDKGLQEKFSKLQDLLEQIMTPELQEAMDKLREAMEEMDPQKMLQALEDFQFNMEDLEEQLDRFIDMFEQAMAEQRMDEVVKRLEEMVAEQNDIVDEFKQEDGQSLSEMASRERRQEENFSRLDQVMKDASEAMEKYAAQPSANLDELRQSELAQNTQQSLSEARQKMQSGDASSEKPANAASQRLKKMLEQAQMIQQQFQQQTVAEMMEEFQKVLQNTLAISSHQESLSLSSAGLRSNSPRLPDINEQEDKIRRRTNQLFAQLMELSRKTFYISPKINQTLGKAQVSMDKSISKLEQKQVSSAIREQKTAMENLNKAARLMLDAMDQMQSSGSASGFESFMEQMQQMSQQQQGINQGTMQLGQMGMMAQQAMMQRLQAQQQALQKSLNDLLSEMPGEDSGGLAKASQDMEEVIKDFKRRQVTRATRERQERILSRMLDSQKSMTRRDYSKKRKSRTGEEMLYSGPAGLPAGLGERDLLLIRAMEDALNEGRSREYQEMMKTYFRELQKNAQKTEAATLEN
ncbi:MAG: DUF4175 domain-containing protein [FCB group bacterium]|nr:DUF4175 domain-containing protein [FCB group bacterium]